MDEQQMSDMAEAIYSAVFGLDDKAFRASKTQEILDWLRDGDTDGCTIEGLIAEWREYDAEEVARQAEPVPAGPCTFGYYEDNGGGLYVFVFGAEGNVAAGVGDLEYTAVSNPGEWAQVKAGMLADPLHEVNSWDGHLDDPQAAYDSIPDDMAGWSLVASEKGLYPYRMGAAAQGYFGIDTNANAYDDLVAHS